MSTRDGRPQAERLAEAHAHELGSELIRTAGAPRRVRVEVQAGGWRIVVEAVPASELPADLTGCERDIVGLLRGQRLRLTTMQVLSALDLAGLLHGECTVKVALARLTRLGVLSNSRAAPKGYLLSDRYQAERAADAG